MGTPCEIVSTGSPAGVEKAFGEIDRVERLISTWREDSELSRVNREAPVRSIQVADELFRLLGTAVEWSEKTGGAFTPMIGPLVDAWGMRTGPKLPEADQQDRATQLAAIESIRLAADRQEVRLTRGASIEEGGFGKGYALDQAMRVLASDGCRSCMINFGGQVAVRSADPVEVFVAHPQLRESEALRLAIRTGSIATTSGSEKWFDSPRGRLSHVIDPRTGEALPPRGSVTVVHDSALVADVLSTALYVMGPDEGLEWANDHDVAAIFIVPEGPVWSVVSSAKANNPGLGLRTVAADFQLKGNP
jgi:thiamine biosynthesis lipoprotein